MRPLAVLFAAAVMLAGCALRPRYADFVSKETTGPVTLQVIEKNSGTPVANAAVEVGELKGRVNVKTDPQGFFVLPVDKQLLADNALIVVTAPSGVGRVQVVATAVAPAVLPEPTVLESVPMPNAEVVDAGTSTY